MGSQSKRKKGTKDNRSIITDIKRETDQDANRTALLPSFEGLAYSPVGICQTDYVDVTDTIDSLQTAGGGGAGGPAPGQVTGLTATVMSDFIINLDWSIPSGSVDFYNVYMSTTSGFTPVSPIANPTVSDYSVAGLSPGTTYYFKVSGVFNGAEGVFSAQATATTTGSAPPANTPPPPDVILSLTDAGISAPTSSPRWQLNIDWQGVAYSPAVTGYKFRFSIDPTFTHFWQQNLSSGGVVNGVTFPTGGMMLGATYYCQALSTNINGDGFWSATQTITIPGPAAGSLSAPTGLNMTPASSTQLDIVWNPVAGATGYRIYVSRWPDNSTYVFLTVGSGQPNVSATAANANILANTIYYVRVSTYNANGEGPLTAADSATTPP
jgi:hypothetical protein